MKKNCFDNWLFEISINYIDSVFNFNFLIFHQPIVHIEEHVGCLIWRMVRNSNMLLPCFVDKMDADSKNIDICTSKGVLVCRHWYPSIMLAIDVCIHHNSKYKQHCWAIMRFWVRFYLGGISCGKISYCLSLFWQTCPPSFNFSFWFSHHLRPLSTLSDGHPLKNLSSQLTHWKLILKLTVCSF